MASSGCLRAWWWRHQVLLSVFPDEKRSTDVHIQRPYGTKLGDFNTVVQKSNDFSRNTFTLISVLYVDKHTERDSFNCPYTMQTPQKCTVLTLILHSYLCVWESLFLQEDNTQVHHLPSQAYLWILLRDAISTCTTLPSPREPRSLPIMFTYPSTNTVSRLNW